MTPAEILDLFSYDRWATGRQFEVVEELTEDQYARDMGSSLGGIRGTLVHIYAAQLIWFTRWRGESPAALVTEADVPRLGELRDRWSMLRVRIDEFAAGLTPAALDRPFAYANTKGVSFNDPLGHQILHLINHSTYHRGQVTTLLRQIGVAPPASIDLITYWREGLEK